MRHKTFPVLKKKNQKRNKSKQNPQKHKNKKLFAQKKGPFIVSVFFLQKTKPILI
jgi:hypothetical protein